jgi:hypothetical protein
MIVGIIFILPTVSMRISTKVIEELAHLVRPRTLTRRLQAHPRLRLGELAFAHDTLMRFVGALDAILGLVIAGKLFDYRENATWYKPTDRRADRNNISDFEFVWHRFLAFPGG